MVTLTDPNTLKSIASLPQKVFKIYCNLKSKVLHKTKENGLLKTNWFLLAKVAQAGLKLTISATRSTGTHHMVSLEEM